MFEQLNLSEKEWRLILELLNNERTELPPEIRRTDTARVHDDLQERMHTVDNLIHRIDGALTGSGGFTASRV